MKLEYIIEQFSPEGAEALLEVLKKEWEEGIIEISNSPENFGDSWTFDGLNNEENILRDYLSLRDRVAPSFLPICDDLMGNYLLLDISKGLESPVYLFWHEENSEEDILHPVFDSWISFLKAPKEKEIETESTESEITATDISPELLEKIKAFKQSETYKKLK